VQQRISHPVQDPKLPSFVHPALADVTAELELVSDCWDLLRANKEKHLPREPKEPRKAYEARLQRSSYASFYRDAIVAYAGALSRFELRDPPPLVQTYQAAIDSDANSLKAFWMVADALTLRDGGCLLTVDMPPGRAASRADEIASGRRPHLARVERRNLVNWRTTRENGREVCTALAILEWAETEDGDYGVKLEPRYRLMRGGDWRVVRLKDANGEWQMETVAGDDGKPMEGTFVSASGQALTRPPVCWYSSNRSGFGRGMLPLLSLANLTLDWFREYSDLKELLHRTAMPVPVRKGMFGMGPGGSTPPMTLGPNSGIDLPKDGEFSFAEVAGGSLAQHVEHLRHIETLIDRQTLSFLFSGDAQKTATQSMLESAQLQATLSSMAEGKSSAMQSLFEIWGQFTGEAIKPGAGINLDSGVFDQPVGVDQVRLAQELYNSSLLTRESVVELEKKAGLLPPSRTVKQEVDALQQEEAEAAADVAPTPGVNDLVDGMPA
jgi:hypothetical protein